MPIYMKVMRKGVPVIKGEVTAKGHEGWIELQSFQFGQTRPSNSGGPGNQEKESSEVGATKVQDSASPALVREAIMGTEPMTIQIDFVKNDAVYLSFSLQSALISSYSLRGSGDRPTESFTLNFTKLTYDAPGLGGDMSDHAKGAVRAANAGNDAS